MKNLIISVICLLIIVFNTVFSQNFQNSKIRRMVDTVGFASKFWQMDEFMKRITLNNENLINSGNWKVCISPHDDYSYVGGLYPELLSGIKSKIIIFFGVTHKARFFNLENKIIFDTFTEWEMPYGNVKVSALRNDIISSLSENSYIIHDSVQILEHSVEAIIPFLQYYNKNVEIISILIPFMRFDDMNEISEKLALSVNSVMSKNNLEWGKDFSFIISSDAVHYGDEDWGGKNYAPFGSDIEGYNKAVAYEYEIIDNCLNGNISPQKIKLFVNYTVDDNNFKEYKWTWCGRYSIPFGLLTSYYLQNLAGLNLIGTTVRYATSIDHLHIPVNDIGMGITAPANIRHWVGYASVGFK